MTSQLCICIYIIGPEDGIEQLDQVLGCLNDELEGMAPRPAKSWTDRTEQADESWEHVRSTIFECAVSYESLPTGALAVSNVWKV